MSDRQITRLVLAAAVVTLAAVPAIADQATSTDWTGFYAGGQVGWQDVEYPSSSPGVPGGILFDGTGGAVGLHAGYNHDFGRFVLGGEVALDFPSMNIDTTPSGLPAPRDIDRITTVKAKAGYDAGLFLPYAVIGYAWQDFKDTAGGSSDQTFDGVAYGLGVSSLVRPNLVAGVEALRYDLDATSGTLSSEGTSISLRMSYRF